MDHPLDRPIWNALTTRQADFAEEAGGVRRFAPVFGPFAASADGTPASYAALASLVPPGGQVMLQENGEIAPPPGLRVVRSSAAVQMVAERIVVGAPTFDFAELGPADAAEMLVLATLTRPGPFAERTNELGRFIGIRAGGRLVAMAGERMRPEGFTEISGVCTHPDHRGRGYAAGLMQEVGRGVLARGETPFLHAYADNLSAIALYERLGFVTRWRPHLTMLQRL